MKKGEPFKTRLLRYNFKHLTDACLAIYAQLKPEPPHPPEEDPPEPVFTEFVVDISFSTSSLLH